MLLQSGRAVLHQFCRNACRLHFCSRATDCQPYGIVAGGAGAGRSGWRTHPPAQQGRRPSVRCDQARRPDARQAVRPTAQSRHLCRRAEPSRKAAFEAWGSDRDLFGRGLAEQVTDENLTRHAFVNRTIRSSRSACGSAGFDARRSRPRAMKYGLSDVARGGATSAIFARSSTASAPLPTAATAYATSRRRLRTCSSNIRRHRLRRTRSATRPSARAMSCRRPCVLSRSP